MDALFWYLGCFGAFCCLLIWCEHRCVGLNKVFWLNLGCYWLLGSAVGILTYLFGRTL